MTELGTDALTLTHVLISLIAIATGLVVLLQMLGGQLSNGWTGIFLATTLLTSLTGFVFFHPPAFTPAQGTGVVALLVLSPTLYGLYRMHMAGRWRAIYVVGAVASLYLNVFVLVVQLFLKVPVLNALAPTGGGPVFGAVQGAVLIAFILAGWTAVKRFHPVPALS